MQENGFGIKLGETSPSMLLFGLPVSQGPKKMVSTGNGSLITLCSAFFLDRGAFMGVVDGKGHESCGPEVGVGTANGCSVQLKLSRTS